MSATQSGDSHDLDESLGGFEMFAARARTDRGAEDPLWRTGFSDAHREGQDALIASYVFQTYDAYFTSEAKSHGVLLDIGGGSGPLCDALSTLCHSIGWHHIVIDGKDMLRHLPRHPNRSTLEGSFPAVLEQGLLSDVQPDLILAYSVLQYAIRDMPLASFLGGVAECLPPGGVALLGDLPNRSKRARHLGASGELDRVPKLHSLTDMSDETISTACDFFRLRGCDAFLLPQPRLLRTWRHREDLWIVQPEHQPYLEEWT